MEEESNKKDLHKMLMQAFKESYYGKTYPLSEKDLEEWAKGIEQKERIKSALDCYNKTSFLDNINVDEDS